MTLSGEDRRRATLGFLALGLLLLQGSFAQEAVHESSIPLEEESTESPLSFVIPLAELGYYAKNESGKEILKAQFHKVLEGQRYSWKAANTSENAKKNRYDDLLAYDKTRVVLDKLPNDNSSDYINANFINGFYREKEYIATQGPLPNTINDFWRMIWQVEAKKIVMLANVMEHGEVKVEKYWPETNETYGNITVKKESEHSMDDHVIRTFLITKNGDFNTRRIRQFHFTGWPDMGVPSNRLSVVSLMSQARKYHREDAVPIVVHCSAGVGRTGTIILMDSMIQRATHNGNVDFLHRLNEMREQRINVVEKEGQYIFAHEAVYDLFYGEGSAEYLEKVSKWYDENLPPEASTPVDSSAPAEVRTNTLLSSKPNAPNAISLEN